MSDEEKAHSLACSVPLGEDAAMFSAARDRIAEALTEARMEGGAEEMRRNALTICDLRVELEQAKAATVALFATVEEWTSEAENELRYCGDRDSHEAGMFLGQIQAYTMVLNQEETK